MLNFAGYFRGPVLPTTMFFGLLSKAETRFDTVASAPGDLTGQSTLFSEACQSTLADTLFSQISWSICILKSGSLCPQRWPA